LRNAQRSLDRRLGTVDIPLETSGDVWISYSSEMSMNNLRPLLVVGAGPTGLVVAIELARRGIPFHLIDRRPEQVRWSQAIFIKSRTLEILAALGLRDQFYALGQIVRRVEVYSNEVNEAFYEFDGLATPFPHILSIPEEQTIRILTAELERLGGAVERGVEFAGLSQDEQQVRAKLRSRERGEYVMDASIVVGTDGYHSNVRDAIADDFEGRDYPELWGVFDTGLSNWSHDRDTVCAQLAVPIVIPFPMGEARWRIYFWIETCEGDVLSRVVERLRVISPNVDLMNPGEPQFFHSHSRLVRKFRAGRVFLAGDAAHASNPIEGHGMNAGIQDAYNLGWKLAALASGEATEDLMESYEAERRPANQTVVRSGDDAYARMMPSGRDALHAFFAFLSTPNGQAFAALSESEIALGYDQSPIIKEIGAPSRASPRTTKIGYRVGDVDGLIRAGRSCNLHDLLATTDPTLFVLLGARPPADVVDALSDVQTVIRDSHRSLSLYLVVHGDMAPPMLSGDVLLDPAGQLHERLGAGQLRLCLVRPDGHLGFSCAPPSAEAVRTHLRQLFRLA
jgi:2-polyprenyl-6-methoxyphenol hydroxylase-like FAD-dependent oxidoreductase